MSGSLYEIRDYHYQRDRMDAYRTWTEQALAVLQPKMDVVGWWIDAGEEPRIMGSEPMDLPHGSANVTWMIRWDSIEQREERWDALWEEQDWLDVWEKHPGFDGYLHMSVRFMDQVEARI